MNLLYTFQESKDGEQTFSAIDYHCIKVCPASFIYTVVLFAEAKNLKLFNADSIFIHHKTGSIKLHLMTKERHKSGLIQYFLLLYLWFIDQKNSKNVVTVVLTWWCLYMVVLHPPLYTSVFNPFNNFYEY